MKQIIILLLGLVLGACSHLVTKTSQDETFQVIQEQADTTILSLGEIESHDNRDDCWLMVDNKVYDVTVYIPEHPGGDSILKGCGKDATEMFAGIKGGEGHSENARGFLEQYYIGNVKLN